MLSTAQPAFELQALEDVAGGIALEPGGDGEHAAVGTLAGSGQNDELGIG
jgi:hypothetical protein